MRSSPLAHLLQRMSACERGSLARLCLVTFSVNMIIKNKHNNNVENNCYLCNTNSSELVLQCSSFVCLFVSELKEPNEIFEKFSETNHNSAAFRNRWDFSLQNSEDVAAVQIMKKKSHILVHLPVSISVYFTQLDCVNRKALFLKEKVCNYYLGGGRHVLARFS